MLSFCLPLSTHSINYTSQGLKKVGELKRGETLVVSGAAGSVGTVACQLGKAAGAKVYAIAGSDDKCLWLEQELGVDKAFNYKSRDFHKDMKKIGYLDVYFDNVGGKSHIQCECATWLSYLNVDRRNFGFLADSVEQRREDCPVR